MSNGIKGLTKVQRDDHYIRVAREQFSNRLKNSNNSCSHGSCWTESIAIRVTQLDRRLKNCWIDELSDTLECSAQDESRPNGNGSKVSVFLRRNGLGNWCNRCQLQLLGNGRSSDKLTEQLGKGPTEDRSPETQEPRRGSKSIPVAVLEYIQNFKHEILFISSTVTTGNSELLSLRIGDWQDGSVEILTQSFVAPPPLFACIYRSSAPRR